MSRIDDNPYRPCPCGSGEKYKFCCLEKDREKRRKTPPMSLVPGYDQPPEDVVEKAREAHDRGTELIGRLRGREAIPYIEKAIRLFPQVPNPHNNLAMAYFLEGEIDKALEIAERVDRDIDPGNVFALGQRVHYLILLGRRDEARAAGDRLAGLRCRDEAAYIKKCEALARLGRHEDVHATALAGLRLHYPGVAYFAGVAAANLGRTGEAEGHLVRAADDPAHGRMAAAHLDRIRRKRGPGTLTGEWPYLELGLWMMPSLVKKIRGPKDARRYPGLVETIGSILDERLENDEAFEMLGMLGTPEAFEMLRRVAFGTFGTDELRTAALRVLQDKGALPKDTTVKMHLGGRWREVRATQHGPGPGPALQEELHPLMSEMVGLLKNRLWSKAAALGRKIVAKAPDSPVALHNLGSALRFGKRRREAEELFRRAMASDPSYLYSPAALIMMNLEDGKIEEAKAVLKQVELKGALDPDAYALYLLAQAELASADGDAESAARAWRLAEKIAPDHPGVAESRKSGYRNLAEGVAGLFEDARSRREKKLRRLLPANPTVADVLAGLSGEEIRKRAQGLRLPRLGGLKKEEMKNRVLEAVKSPDLVRAAVRQLEFEEREALRAIVRSGGPVSYEDYVKTPSPADEGPIPLDLPVHRLADLGFVAIGQIGRGIAIVIPSDLRPAIEAELGT
jgi:tetratricopeptide (TPR) repeat protein